MAIILPQPGGLIDEKFFTELYDIILQEFSNLKRSDETYESRSAAHNPWNIDAADLPEGINPDAENSWQTGLPPSNLVNPAWHNDDDNDQNSGDNKKISSLRDAYSGERLNILSQLLPQQSDNLNIVEGQKISNEHANIILKILEEAVSFIHHLRCLRKNCL